jgi:Major capsid protein 13-like
MVTSLASDFKIYEDYTKTRIAELLAQNGNAFGAASNNCLRIATQSRPGNYAQSSFFKNVTGLVSRRDNTSIASLTDLGVSMEEYISVKLSRKIGPVMQTRDSYKKLLGGQFNPALFAATMAEEAANAMQIDMLDSALAGLAAALKQVTASYYTQSSLGKLDTDSLIGALAKMGDRADRVVCWVMHSKTYFDLVRAQIVQNIVGISNFNVASATPVTMGRPVVVTDSASLLWGSSPDVQQYYTLGLVEGAALIENTEEQEVVIQDVTGLQTLGIRYQGEFAYNLGLKGFKWDTANGLANPLLATMKDGSNWDTAFADMKDRAGVVITST